MAKSKRKSAAAAAAVEDDVSSYSEEQEEEKASPPPKKAAAAKKGTTPAKKAAKPVDKTGDHPPPKRPGSAWLYFNTDFGKKFVAGGGDRKGAFTAAGVAWSAMDEEAKRPFTDLANEALVRVTAQREELKKKGYYTLADGTKSTDDVNAHLLKVKKKRSKKVVVETSEDEGEESKAAADTGKAKKGARKGKPEETEKLELDVEEEE